MHGDGNPVNSRAVCRYPECLIGKCTYRTPMSNLMGIFLPAAVHDNTGVSVMGFGDLHTQKLRKFAPVECRYPLGNDLFCGICPMSFWHAYSGYLKMVRIT
jgi:hypothetical protein